MKGFKAFCEYLKDNEELKKSILSMVNVEDIIAKAKELGFQISPDDVENLFSIDDNVLAKVAGGFNIVPDSDMNVVLPPRGR